MGILEVGLLRRTTGDIRGVYMLSPIPGRKIEILGDHERQTHDAKYVTHESRLAVCSSVCIGLIYLSSVDDPRLRVIKIAVLFICT